MHKKLGFKLTDLPKIKATDNSDSFSFKQSNYMTKYFLKEGFTDFYINISDNKEMLANFFRRNISSLYPRESYRIYLSLKPWQVPNIESLLAAISWVEENFNFVFIDFLCIEDVSTLNVGEMESAGIFDAILNLKMNHRVGKIGFSFYDTTKMLEEIFNSHHEFDFVELPINYLDIESENLPFVGNYKLASLYNKRVFATSCLKGGALVTKIPPDIDKNFSEERPDYSSAAWALKYVCSLVNVETAFVAMNTTFDMFDNLTFLSDFMPFKESEFSFAKKMASKLKRNLPMACIDCNKCVSVCPMKINIPAFLAIYNHHSFEDNPKNDSPLLRFYRNYSNRVVKLSECTRCGKCEKVCERGLPICDTFNEMEDKFTVNTTSLAMKTEGDETKKPETNNFELNNNSENK